ncbi:MAG: alpha/beta hydrolase [Fusobacteriaceae bacterium]
MDFYRILLVHGFLGSSEDMNFIENFLSNLGFRVDNLELPLTFENIEVSEKIIKEKIISIKESKFEQHEELILIGYGIGGILVRKVVEKEGLKNSLVKMLLIASPTKTPIITKKLKIFIKPLSFIFKPLKIFLNNEIEKIEKPENTAVGIIRGTEHSSKIYQKWLKPYNDGIYNNDEVVFDNEKDNEEFEILNIPFGHKELHKKQGTAEYILDFIETGRFITDKSK